MADEQLYDVVIYNYETREIHSIVGKGMYLSLGYYNAEKRLETALSQCNDNYGAEIVETKKYKEGDMLAE